VVCGVGVVSQSKGINTISLEDFALVDAENFRFPAIVLPRRADDPATFEKPVNLPPNQSILLDLGFQVPTDAQEPWRVEIVDSQADSDEYEPTIIILEDWMTDIAA
jgi:hypothetical protein